MILNTILIDDENKARENLRLLIQKHCANDLRIVNECGNIEEAYTAIISLNPTLIFLDIEMTNGTGFDLLNRFTHYPFKVIFVTAFDQYAIRAFKFCALDYLLKPVSTKELLAAVEKAKTSATSDNNEQMQSLTMALQHPKQKHSRIAIPVQNGYQLVPVDKIMLCAAEKQYTDIYLESGTTICSSLNLGEYEELLTDHDFFRVHHSYMLNRQYIRQYIRGEGGEVIMENKMSIPVSRRKKQEFINWLTK
jgi:two-component system, LytTR family, response regulator